MVDPFNYLSFQPVLHDWSNKGRVMYYPSLWKGAYKRTLAGNRKACRGQGKGKEGNVLFNDALNTFYLRLYGVRHMAKDHSDSEKGNPLPPHRLLFPINNKSSFIYTIPQTG